MLALFLVDVDAGVHEGRVFADAGPGDGPVFGEVVEVEEVLHCLCIAKLISAEDACGCGMTGEYTDDVMPTAMPFLAVSALVTDQLRHDVGATVHTRGEFEARQRHRLPRLLQWRPGQIQVYAHQIGGLGDFLWHVDALSHFDEQLVRVSVAAEVDTHGS